MTTSSPSEDDFTFVHGKHQFVFGGEIVHNQLNISNAYETNGVYTFGGNYSVNGPNGGTKTGDNNLDFLMGALSAFQQSKYQQNALRGNIPSLYAQEYVPRHATTYRGRRHPLVAGVPAHRLLQPRHHL